MAHFIALGLPWPIPLLWGLPWPILFFWASSARFISLGIPRPIPILHSHGLLLSLLLLGFIGFLTNPICLVPSFRLLCPIFACFPFPIMPNGFTTSFVGLLWARLLSSRHFCYFTSLWTIIPAIWA